MHCYEDDAAFERLWSRPERYLPILKRYAGVIAPDFSLYRDMPLVMQQWNVYRSRAIAHWLQENGIPVIANVRWGDRRTTQFGTKHTYHTKLSGKDGKAVSANVVVVIQKDNGRLTCKIVTVYPDKKGG